MKAKKCRPTLSATKKCSLKTSFWQCQT